MRVATWPELRALALGLNLPEVTLAYPWNHETLKAFGKTWTYWAALTDAAVFKCDKAERTLLWEAEPQTFLSHPHYDPHNLLLVRAGQIDPGWAKARLIRTWREAAPKRFLKAWDAMREGM